MRRIAIATAKGAGCAAILCVAYLSLLRHPEPLFAYSVTCSNITFYSHSALPRQVAAIAAGIEERLATSELYEPGLEQRVFVVEWRWLWNLLNGPYRGAVARNVELGDAILVPTLDVVRQEIRHFDGRSANAVHVLTHEAAHTLVRHRIGVLRLWRLQWWQKEGYPEYVASRGGTELAAPASYQRAARIWKFLLETRHLTFDEVIGLRDSPPKSSTDARLDFEEARRATRTAPFGLDPSRFAHQASCYSAAGRLASVFSSSGMIRATGPFQNTGAGASFHRAFAG